MIRDAIRDAGLSGRNVCLHSSMRSFGWLPHGARDVLDAFLDEGCTLVVPTFSLSAHGADPSVAAAQPTRNGETHRRSREPRTPVPFTPASLDIDADMGAIAAAVVRHPDRIRGEHPINSFSALGPNAAELVSAQSPEEVHAPLARVATTGGAVVLAGVDMTKLTLIHLAEKDAGRHMFVRWALVPEGPMATRVGGCSSGFERLARVLAVHETRTAAGASPWRIFPAQETLATAARAIRADPSITRCRDRHCARCCDAIAGGPEF